MISEVKAAVGIIQSIDPTNYTASVKLVEYENQITETYQILTPLSFQNKISCIPKVNTPVVVLLIGDDAENGFIIGSYYSKKNNCEEKQDEFKINFQNSILTIKENGETNIDAKVTTINSEQVNINAEVSISKSLKVGKNIKANNLIEGNILKDADGILGVK
ncbi:MAG: phage baseplate protein [Fusobacteriales bacterium]|nr:MAG: phage baseplate protein [Fusobacteriales bacterium]